MGLGLGLFASLIIGGIAGWLAGMIKRDGGFGILGNIVVGVIGGLIGGAIYSLIGDPQSVNWFLALILATIGAVILLSIVNMIKK